MTMIQLALIQSTTKVRNPNHVPILQMEKSNSLDKMVHMVFLIDFCHCYPKKVHFRNGANKFSFNEMNQFIYKIKQVDYQIIKLSKQFR